MRPTACLPAACLLLALGAAAVPAIAGTVVVDTTLRSIDTSRLFLKFNPSHADHMLQVTYKDYGASQILTGYVVDMTEFWGQAFRSTNNPGFCKPLTPLLSQWNITVQTGRYVEVTTTTQSVGEPVVVTRYGFFADQPYFTVARTIQFATQPDTASYQAYVPRLALLGAYHALRWRDTTGAVIQRGYCILPCLETNWDGHWLEHMSQVGGTALGVGTIFSSAMPAHPTLVRGYGPNSGTGWATQLVPAGAHTGDETSSQMIFFTRDPSDYATIDSLWTVFNSGQHLLAVGDAPGRMAPGLTLAPNPTRGRTSLRWSVGVAGLQTLDVLDLAGRRVARLRSGWSAAGEREATWDGRDAEGRRVPPGLYFVRLATSAGTRTARLALTN